MFEWNEEKREINLRKHRIDFWDAKEIWNDPVIEILSDQTKHDEDRYLGVGMMGDICITVVFTWRGENRRIISARKARRYEQENYDYATRQGFEE